MGNIEQNGWRQQAIFASIILMLASLFISRPLLSISLFIFLLLTLFHSDIVSQLRRFINSPWLILMALLFMVPFVSGLWSENYREWQGVLRVKLPFLLLPIAFAGKWQLSSRQWTNIAYAFLLIVAIGCCASLVAYLMDMEAINESYLKAKTLPAPLGDDHVRFSWIVTIAIILSVMQLKDERRKSVQWMLGCALLLFIVYLHVLSARTGLTLTYLFLVSYAMYNIANFRRQTILIAIAIALIALASWLVLPTLQNRIRYNLYDISHIQHHTYRSGTSDGNRLISLKAGCSIIGMHPFGVGAGDVRAAANAWYSEHVPAMQDSDKIYPSSEWIVYGMMAGWPGIVLFTLIILYPVFLKEIARRFFWVSLCLLAGLSFVIETSLEIQYGVFIYSFVLLWWWKWLTFEKQITLKHD